MTQQASPLYLIEVGFHEPWFHEPRRELTRAQLVNDIIEGQFEKVVRVIEIGAPDGLSGSVGHWRDITKDIASEVADQFYRDREPVSHEMANWLHRHLGVMSTRGLVAA